MQLKKRQHFYRFLFFLYIGLSCYTNTLAKPSSYNTHKFQEVVKHFEKSFVDFCKKDSIIELLCNKSYHKETLKLFKENIFFEVYLYNNRDSLLFWSNNSFIPAPSEILTPCYLKEGRNGFYLLKKANVKIANQKIQVIGSILVKTNFKINNHYLQNENGEPFKNIPNFVISDKTTIAQPILDLQGNPLFYIEFIEDKTINQNEKNILFVILTIIFILIIGNYQFIFIRKKINGVTANLVLLTFVISLRILFQHITKLGYFDNWEFFSPYVYASGPLLSSLADFCINILLGAWLIITSTNSLKRIGHINSKIKLIIPSLVYSTILLVFHIVIYLLHSLVFNSSLSFDISNIIAFDFFAIICLIFICLAFITFFIATINLLSIIKEHSIKIKLISFLSVVFIYLLIYISDDIFLIWDFLLFCFYILIIEFFFFKQRNLFNYLKIIFFAAYFTLLLSVSLNLFNNQKIVARTDLFAQSIYKPKSGIIEILFKETINNIKNDEYFIALLSDSSTENTLIYNYVDSIMPRAILKDFNLDIHTQTILPHGNKIVLDEHQLSAKNIISITKISNDIPVSYKAKISVHLPNQTNRELAILLKPRENNKSKLYPELLISNSENSINKDLSYAIYKQKILTYTKGEINYPKYFNPTLKNFDHGYHYSIYPIKKDVVLIIGRVKLTFFSSLALFSYIYFIFILVLFFTASIYYLSHFRNKKIVFQLKTISIKRKIQAAMLFVILFSFLAVSILTYVITKDEYNEYHYQRLLRKSESVARQVNLSISTSKSHEPKILNSFIKNLTNIHSIDINIYATNGKLLGSSQKDIFNIGLISKQIDPIAFNEIIKNETPNFIQNEQIGKLNYLSAYIPIKYKNKIIYILNVPYFSKEKDLDNETNTFLVGLTNIYLLSLILSSLIVLAISNYITQSFILIGQKLKQISLTGKNDPIQWHTQDEIGILVNEYNKMIGKLAQSTRQLAISERESAWRDVAKQVAHEIKNPLTPMKLNIQQLQRAQKDNNPELPNMIERLSKSLIEQIEALSHIASEFSSFAKMPKAKLVKMDIYESLNSVLDLFKDSKDLSLQSNIEYASCYILADKDQLLRVLNNVIKNAIQAIPSSRKGRINLSSFIKGDKVIISIEDNGIGILDSEKEKVFVPNFTTKSSGTGIGLAMAKNIIEQASGKIWFETTINVGTTFYIELPVLKD